MAEATSINAAGAIVTGVNGTMPIIGGDIVVLDFIPANVIIGGYFDLFLLAERSGAKLSQSEHVKFVEDQTVFKGTARYDGLPVIAEGFVAFALNGGTVSGDMSFPEDEANPQ
jgi:HK97 family phage major capsid protein